MKIAIMESLAVSDQKLAELKNRLKKQAIPLWNMRKAQMCRH